jgi:hypothetical protein
MLDITRLLQPCVDSLVTSLLYHCCNKLLLVNSLSQTCYNKLGTRSANTTCRQLVNRLVCRLVTTCAFLCVYNVVPTTLSTRCLLNRLVASLLTSCDNGLRTTCQQDVSSTGLFFFTCVVCMDRPEKQRNIYTLEKQLSKSIYMGPVVPKSVSVPLG